MRNEDYVYLEKTGHKPNDRAAKHGPLANYTFQQLLDLRDKGLDNPEIAKLTGSTTTRVGIVIGRQPGKQERMQLMQRYNARVAEKAAKTELKGQTNLPIVSKTPAQIIATPTEQEAPGQDLPPITRLDQDNIRISLNGFTFDLGLTKTADRGMDISTIRIRPTASNWITIPSKSLDSLCEALYDVKELLKKLNLGGSKNAK